MRRKKGKSETHTEREGNTDREQNRSEQQCRQHLFIAQWVQHTSSVLLRRVQTPGGIETHRTSRKPLYARAREWVTVGGGPEREKEREGGGRGRPSERELETNRHSGRVVGAS